MGGRITRKQSMRSRLVLLFLSAILIAGSTSKSNHENIEGSNRPPINGANLIKVKVTQKGEVFLDDKSVTLVR